MNLDAIHNDLDYNSKMGDQIEREENMTNSLDPTLIRLKEPMFYHETLKDILCDKDGNEVTCVVSFWKSESEIKDVIVSCPDIEYSDFDYDVRGLIRKNFGKIEIIGKTEKL